MGGSARASSGGLRFFLLALFAAGLLLTPAAQASADVTLTIDIVGEGRLECEVETEEEAFSEECEEGDHVYPEGAEVRIFPEEEFGWEFVEFSGACNLSPCELTLDSDREVTAVFELEEFALEIETDGGPGTGTVQCELEEGPGPCASEYPGGTEINLIAVPDPGSEAVEFSGSCEEFGPECELLIEEDSTVIVTFEFVGPRLTIKTAGTGSGTVKCKADGGALKACAPAYPEETELLLVASANPGSQFAGWSGGCTADPCELLVEEEDLAVTATFNLEPTTTGGGGAGSDTGGAGGGAGTKPPAPPGKLSVSGAALFQGGKAVLKLSCKGQGPCKGSLKLVAKLKVGGKLKNVEIGKASFSLTAGTSKALKVKLAAAAKKVLGKAKTVKATVSGSGVTKSTVTIKPTAR